MAEEIVPKKDAREYEAQTSIVIPCRPDEFGGFLSGLLRVPKTLKYSRASPFVLTYEDVVDFDRLIEQRIGDQQSFSKVSVEASAYYRDGTSIHSPSLEDFSKQASLGAELCERVSFSVVYLIAFPNNQIPQRQEITIDYATSYGPKSRKKEEIDIRSIESTQYFGSSFVELQIRHTHVTFGHDLASLLKERIKKTIVDLGRERILHSEGFSLTWLLLSMALGVLASVYVVSFVFYVFFDLTELFSEGQFSAMFFNAIAIATGATMLTMTLFTLGGLALKEVLVKKPESFIVLNHDHKLAYDKSTHKRKRNLLTAVGAVVSATLIGAVGSILGTGVWEGWLARIWQ